MKNSFVLFILILGALLTSNAQMRAVNGNVYAFKDLALKNIQVSAKKSKANVLTDSLGQFLIVCDKNDKLTFEGKGFIKVFKRVNKEDNLSIKMMFIKGLKNEELAIGYGHISKDKLTWAVNNLSAFNNDYCNFTDVYGIIEGRFPGVQVVNSGGSKKVLIRGVSSVNSDIYALLIVDGVPVASLDYIHPSTVQSINIIKEGAIYGSRGANGVVLVTTIGAH